LTASLADRVHALRAEILELGTGSDRDPPGAEVFDAVIRRLASRADESAQVDATLHDAIARRLAWGESEQSVLVDIDSVYGRLVRAANRMCRDPGDEIAVVRVATEVLCAAARLVAMAALGRAGRERAAHMREELAKSRLRRALERQQEEIERLREVLETS
jgi:hypothetical protein